MINLGNIEQKAVAGGFWVFTGRILSRALSFIRIIIVARILAPDDFGLFGLALLSLSILETFSQTGFGAALVQKKGRIKEYLDTAWFVQAIRGMVIFLVLYFSSSFIASFFNNALLVPLVKVIGITILLKGFINTGLHYFNRELKFDKLFFYEMFSTAVDFSVTVVLAFLLRNVWALILGLLAGTIVRLFLSYILHPYRPGLNFDFHKAKELYSFGKWIFITSILLFLVNQGDDLLVGKVVGIAALGFYQMAYRISNTPTTEITHLISGIVFPVYSKLQDKLDYLRKGYLKTLELVLFFSFPLTVFILFFAKNFTLLFLGEKWLPIVLSMQVLVFWGLIRSIGACTGPLFNAVGRPEITTKMIFIKLVLMLSIIFPLTYKLGILGAAIAVTVSGFITRPITDYILIKTLKCRLIVYLKTIFVPMLNSAILFSVLFFIKKYFIFQLSIKTFMFISLFGGTVYLLLALLFSIAFDYTIFNSLKTIFRNNLSIVKQSFNGKK